MQFNKTGQQLKLYAIAEQKLEKNSNFFEQE
jgi:hypothetical protein